MCGRFHFTQDVQKFFSACGLGQLSLPIIERNAEDVCPGDQTIVLASNRNRQIRPFVMSWGYHLPNGKLVFNTRSETVAEKTMFQNGIRQRRCLIPADRYYEWENTPEGKVKYRIAPEGAEGFFLAGIYRMEGSTPVFSVLTQNSAEEIQFIHDRMPVIVPPELVKDWLDPSLDGSRVLSSLHSKMSYQKVV